MHQNPMRPWTVTQLAQSSALSRSAFFERFNRIVGVAPMQYLVAWRMSLARKLLQNGDLGVAQLAERVTYSSGSTFSVVFTRHVGLPPSRYAMQPPPAGGA
jgi:AraC-like DNA-binding protein